MEILEGDIRLSENNYTTSATDNSVIVYIPFTSTSVSEESNLSYRVDYDVNWDVSISLVKCIRDASGKTYAIKVVCPSFLISVEGGSVRTITIEGTIRTNSPDVFSNVEETIRVRGCSSIETQAVLNILA